MFTAIAFTIYKQFKDSNVCIQRIRPMQWLTATIGLLHSCATVRATSAVETRGAPIPGPVDVIKVGLDDDSGTTFNLFNPIALRRA